MILNIDAIVTDAFSAIDGIDFCVAVGSYGGCELAQIRTKKDNPKVYNDIDLLIIINQNANVDQIISVQEEISKKLDLDWVDFLIWKQKDLIKKRRTIAYFDLYHSHRVLIGNKDEFIKYLRPLQSNKILKYDIKALFRTRSWSMLSLYTSDNFFNDDQRFKNYQCAKAIFAISDFISLQYGSYQSSYIKKRDFIKSLPDKTENHFIKTIIDDAYKVKLNPDTKSLNYIIESDVLRAKLGQLYLSSILSICGENVLSKLLYFHVLKYVTYIKLGMKSILVLRKAPFQNCYNRFQIEKKFIELNKKSNDVAYDKKFVKEIELLLAEKF